MSNVSLELPDDFDDYEWEVAAKGWFSEGGGAVGAIESNGFVGGGIIKPPPGCPGGGSSCLTPYYLVEAGLQATAVRLPNFCRFAFCASLRGGSLNSRAAVPPRILCFAFSDKNGRS
jgi:hypothetical protein